MIKTKIKLNENKIKNFKFIGVIASVIFGLYSNIAYANISGGGNGKGQDVTVKDDGNAYILDNGIVSIRINKTSASIEKFNFNGLNLFEGGHGGGSFYWSWNAPKYGGPKGTATIVVSPDANKGDYAEIKIHSPWSGSENDAAMDVDVYYSLKRGAQGYYATSVLSHPQNYPKLNIGEWRSNAYVSPIFEWLSVDEKKQRLMPKVEDMKSSIPVVGAPKEVTQITTGKYAGEFECKYTYSADLGELDAWGWSSISKKIGIWQTVPSHEYYNGGPMKRELTVHMNHTLLNMLNGTHYNQGNQLNIDAGTTFKKTYGPYFIYANKYNGPDNIAPEKIAQTLWNDAKSQAKAEQAAWPYKWFKNQDYVQAEGRGELKGILKIKDSYNPYAKSSAVWIGLAPDDNGVNFQYQGRTYQFWVKTNEDGSFTIPNVISGKYNLIAFGGGNIGEYSKADINIKAGEKQDIGTVIWSPNRVASTIWEIGIPNRDITEFNNGAFNYSQWSIYSKSLAEAAKGQNYTIGKSDYSKDWNYAQFGPTPWNIDFDLASNPSKDAIASLYVALASSENTISVTVNGVQIGTIKPKVSSHAPVRLGTHGPFSDARLNIPTNLLQKGNNIISFTQIGGKSASGTTQYDYIRLEANGIQLKK